MNATGAQRGLVSMRDLVRRSDAMGLILPARHDLIVRRQRRQVIDARVRTTTVVVALLTIAWIAIDSVTFSGLLWQKLTACRIAAGVLLTVISLPALHHREGPLVELRALASLLIILGFYLASIQILKSNYASVESFAGVTAYTYLPFLIGAGISLFPVVAAEGLATAVLVVLATMLTAMMGTGSTQEAYNTGSLWLLMTICGVATLGGMLQFRLLLTVTEQSNRDGLTGLLRRGVGQELLAAQFATAERAGTPLSVLFLDLDRFKAVNDNYGHNTGDSVLVKAATAIRDGVRRQDTAVRWGGEEFLVILPNTDAAAARIVAERFGKRGLGARPEGAPVTASVGLAERSTDHAESAMKLISIADSRVYAAKAAGRNCIVDVMGARFPFTPAAAQEQQNRQG